VTATAECFGLRPVANAFGTSVSMIATRGFGRSASAQRRSTSACSSGASCGVTTRAPDAASASRSDVKNCTIETIAMITTMPTVPTFVK
jgi:hypothetical protein